MIFTGDITGDRLNYLQSGDDLVIRIDGDATSQVTVTDWFLGGENQLAYIQPSGESAITAAEIKPACLPLPPRETTWRYRLMSSSIW